MEWCVPHERGTQNSFTHYSTTPSLYSPSLDLHLAVNPELLDALAQRGARDAEQLGGMDLVVVGFLERLNHQLTLDGGDDLQFRIAPRLLEQLAR